MHIHYLLQPHGHTSKDTMSLNNVIYYLCICTTQAVNCNTRRQQPQLETFTSRRNATLLHDLSTL